MIKTFEWVGIAQLVEHSHVEGPGFQSLPGQQKKKERNEKRGRFTYHCHNAPHKTSVQSGPLQSRVWMVHAVAVLHLLAVMTVEPASGCFSKLSSADF